MRKWLPTIHNWKASRLKGPPAPRRAGNQLEIWAPIPKCFGAFPFTPPRTAAERRDPKIPRPVGSGWPGVVAR